MKLKIKVKNATKKFGSLNTTPIIMGRLIKTSIKLNLSSKFKLNQS